MTEPQTGNNNVVAALDIGSNSFHLIVARIIDGSLQVLHKVKQNVRLAQGLSDDDILDQEAMDRGLACLAQMRESLAAIPPENVRVVATYTLRKAINSRAFIKQAEAVFPFPIEIIPGKEEARLIYQGIANTVSDEGRKLVIDIGGGSTELIIGDGFKPLKLTSRSMGCVSFTKNYFANGKITDRAFKKAIIAAKQELEDYSDDFKDLSWSSCHGTSGTIKAIREAIIQNNWSTEHKIELNHLYKLKSLLIEFGSTENVLIPGVSEQRNPVLAGGLSILIGVFELFEIKQLRYEDAALREGVLYETEVRFKHFDIRERTIESLTTRYQIDTAQVKRVARSADFIFQQIKHDWSLSPKYHALLLWASKLVEIGLHIHSTAFHKHSAYILQYTDMPGFNQEEQAVLAFIVRYHRKKFKLDDSIEFSLFKKQHIIKITRILRVAAILNLRRRDDYLPSYKVSLEQDNLHIQFPEGFLDVETLLFADLETEQLMQSNSGYHFTFG
ncbi:exopolyphosphatase [Catenovulum maritimum]|uniref:Exopolyphosphatase n=1 Tax=Catenovulum maritimum TaxID=1513271 RepID=A0A0J8GMS6_9ALTE|nr:exopolyphosphatase [Catenovulum maritimum]KMT64100.1 phosphatase [Catenovulum maritimum]